MFKKGVFSLNIYIINLETIFIFDGHANLQSKLLLPLMCPYYLTFTSQLLTHYYNIIYLKHSFILEVYWGKFLTYLWYTTKETLYLIQVSNPCRAGNFFSLQVIIWKPNTWTDTKEIVIMWIRAIVFILMTASIRTRAAIT